MPRQKAPKPAPPKASAPRRAPLSDRRLAAAQLVRAQQGRLRTLFGPALQRAEAPGGLPAALREGVESLSGIDLDGLAVRRNSPEPARIGAAAFARDPETHLAPGAERHLPHETWHIVQQRQGRVAPTRHLRKVAINDDPALEREADRMGAAAQRAAAMDPPVQRFAPNMARGAAQGVVQGLFNIAMAPVDGGAIVSGTTYKRDSDETTGGPHVSANSLFVHQVERTIHGKSFAEAFTALRDLYAARLEAMGDAVEPKKAPIADLAAKTYAHLHDLDPAHVPPFQWVSVLQDLALAYLRMRNSRQGAIDHALSGRDEFKEDTEEATYYKALGTWVHLREADERARGDDDSRSGAQADDDALGADELLADEPGRAAGKRHRSGGMSGKRRRQKSDMQRVHSLAARIAAWADHAPVKAVDKARAEATGGPGADRFVVQAHMWKRHFDDAMIALGIPHGAQLVLDGAERDIGAVLWTHYVDAVAGHYINGSNSVARALRSLGP